MHAGIWPREVQVSPGGLRSASRTIIYSHPLNFPASVCTRIYILVAGRLSGDLRGISNAAARAGEPRPPPSAIPCPSANDFLLRVIALSYGYNKRDSVFVEPPGSRVPRPPRPLLCPPSATFQRIFRFSLARSLAGIKTVFLRRADSFCRSRDGNRAGPSHASRE